jgi:hypothetical protein
MVNGLRKTAWVTIFRYIYIYTYIYIYIVTISVYIYIDTATYINQKTELMESGNFGLFAANVKWKWQTSICFLQKEMDNGI